MESPDKILSKMEHVLDDLVENAESLKSISLEVVSENELNILQRKQEKLVRQLNDLQGEFQKASKNAQLDPQLPVTQRIMSKLQSFQQLNAAFIENLNSNRGVIKFDKNTPQSQ